MAFFTFFAMMLFIYFLPLQYQAVKNHSAERSGIDILPLMLGVVIFSGISGAIITKTGHYWTVLLIGPMVLAVGGGLFYTVKSTTSDGELIGLQFLVSAGIGVVMQNLIIAIQANVASERDVPLGS
jgi:isoprenylcysteine carboxyl methyltransferase (ICMT) family protein YpbQ